MKYIFLDVDGVLNSEQDGFSVDLETDRPFQLLKNIVDTTGAKIILSSSWRIGLRNGRNNVLIERLAEFGLTIEDMTPENREYWSRGQEIRGWLVAHDYDKVADQFVILDDETFDIRELYGSQLVQTDSRYGLTTRDAKKCLEKLNN